MKNFSTRKCFVLVLLLLVFFSIPSHFLAQNTEEFIGIWQGILSVQVLGDYDVTLEFNLDENKKILGTIDIPKRDVKNLKLSELKIDDRKISFKIPNRGNPVWIGEINKSGLKIEGIHTGRREGTFTLEKVK